MALRMYHEELLGERRWLQAEKSQVAQAALTAHGLKHACLKPPIGAKRKRFPPPLMKNLSLRTNTICFGVLVFGPLNSVSL